jgi:arsenate reductase
VTDEARGDPIRVSFGCGGKAERSQLAEAILRREGGSDFEVMSAGTWPKDEVDPLTVRALDEIGLDVREARTKPVTDYVDEPFDYVITICDKARAACPVFPGAVESMHWGLDDPADATGTDAERLAFHRRLMTEIAVRMRTFIELARRAHPRVSEAPVG